MGDNDFFFLTLGGSAPSRMTVMGLTRAGGELEDTRNLLESGTYMYQVHELRILDG